MTDHWSLATRLDTARPPAYEPPSTFTATKRPRHGRGDAAGDGGRRRPGVHAARAGRPARPRPESHGFFFSGRKAAVDTRGASRPILAGAPRGGSASRVRLL